MRLPELYYHDKLTIVLPLLSREALTIRYLEYLASIKFPFRILVADGGKDPHLQRVLENKEIASHLNYTYIRFPYDQTLLDFYSKNKRSIELVETPYVMFNCNDDIPLVSGLCKSIDFLEKHSQYVGSSGKVGGFFIEEGRQGGRLHFYEDCYEGGSIEAFEQASSLDRIRYQILNNKSCNLYYGMYRTEIVKEISSDLVNLNFKDLLLYETYWISALMSFGKINFFKDSYTYFRQRGVSEGTTFLKRWYANVFFNNWMIEIERYIDALSVRIFENDPKKISLQEI